MRNNDVLHALLAMLEFDDVTAAQVFGHGGRPIAADAVPRLRARRTDPESTPLDDTGLRAFLDGLIVHRRGARDDRRPVTTPSELSRNEVLKKLRIAFDLREDGMRQAFMNGGAPLSKGAFSALFRKPGHRSYRACSEELLFQFLKGLTTMLPP